ncbi:MAG: asparagine synthase (glutamine-hydrolyzing) [Opitutus sp.]|nr:asparagine synthase (glutamine-hydrolyzing) [Opitutus sp.]
MCGIVAFLSRHRPVDPEALQRATAMLHHRGPDNQRQWISSDGRVGLGHARLSIIDLTTGDQPLVSEDGKVHVVVNGEFYDFERIRGELEKRGHHFRTRSDSEIALHLYEDTGVHCLPQLRGEFAFALWDERNHTLFAARDRFGIKPLFYAVQEGNLFLASEVKALFAAGVPARWDHEYFYQVATGPTLPDRSLFAGVHQVPPGHYLLATPAGLRVLPYWDFDYPLAADLAVNRRDDGSYIEQFRAVLDEAVRLRMRADVPVGCYLSGGLDSCAVLGLAARHAPQPIHAFTLTFDQADYDESAIAREMAAHAGAHYYPIPIKQADIADHFADAIWQAETMFFNGHGVSKYLLSRAVRDAGYKVVFTGEGSDEILGGYAHFRRDMLLHNAEGQDPADVRRLLQELEDTNSVSRGLLLPSGECLPVDAIRRTLGFVPTWFEIFGAMAVKRLSVLAGDFKAHFADRDSASVFLNQFDVPGQLTGRDPLNQSLYLWAKASLPNYILVVLGDRMEMAHSIEGRVPFLDHHVVECLRQVPVALKIRGMTEKYILREATRHVITDTVYRRQKHPFLSPPVTTLPGERFHELLQDTLRGSSLAALPFYDQKKVVARLDRLPEMTEGDRVAWDPTLMSILSACVLRERFGLT